MQSPIAWYFRAHLQLLVGDAALVLASCERAVSFCDEHGFTGFRSWFTIFKGWAMCQQGRADEGVTVMAAAIAVNEERGARINRPMFLCLLAEGEARRPNPGRALALVDQALAIRGEDQLFESEMHRHRGELLAGQGPGRRDEAVDSLCQAIAIAKRQGAVAFLRRAEAAAVLHSIGVHGSAAGAGGAEAVLAGDGNHLSRREREVLALIGRGRTDKEIAVELGIKVATVHTHLDRIRDKTGQRRRFGLACLAADLGLGAEYPSNPE